MRPVIVASLLLASVTAFRGSRAADPRAVVEIVAPPGAQIAIDGKPLGTAPLGRSVEVAPGDHEVSALFDGAPHATRVNAARGVTTRASFLVAEGSVPTPAAAAMPPTPAVPVVAAASPPSAAPASSSPPETGSAHSNTRVVVPGILATGALLSLGAGIVLAARSSNLAGAASGLRSQHSDSYCYQNQSDPYCADLAGDVHGQNADFTAATVFYCASGALALATVATWLFWPKGATEAPTVSFSSPTVGRGGSIMIGGVLPEE